MKPIIQDINLGYRTLVDNLPLPGWAPQRSWHMGIGASGSRPARYVSDVKLTSGLVLGLAVVPVRVSMHGQQFARVGSYIGSNGPNYAELNFGYTSLAVVSHLNPASGPASEATEVVISGANFDLGLGMSCMLRQITNSSTHTEIIPATLFANITGRGATEKDDSRINCTIPIDGPWSVGNIDIFVIFDNGVYGPGRPFDRYATPILQRLTPLIGVGASTREHFW